MADYIVAQMAVSAVVERTGRVRVIYGKIRVFRPRITTSSNFFYPYRTLTLVLKGCPAKKREVPSY